MCFILMYIKTLDWCHLCRMAKKMFIMLFTIKEENGFHMNLEQSTFKQLFASYSTQSFLDKQWKKDLLG